jgi:hypothetical protein
MTEGIVISLEILAIGMGDRGSKSDKDFLSEKEQRVDGSSVKFIALSIFLFDCKVYSSRRETGSRKK